MSNVIQLDIEKTGFPVRIGEVELWFSTSPESLRRYIGAEKTLHEEMKRLNIETMNIELPDTSKVTGPDDVDIEVIDEAFEYTKKSLEIQYDILFGEGTFKKIYAVYEDVEALENLLEPLSKLIADEIEKHTKEREKTIAEKSREYAKKKQQKAKK